MGDGCPELVERVSGHKSDRNSQALEPTQRQALVWGHLDIFREKKNTLQEITARSFANFITIITIIIEVMIVFINVLIFQQQQHGRSQVGYHFC